jgi:O-antigen/teichoic acid export membrane protein
LLIRVLNYDEFGQYSLFTTAITFVTSFITGPLSSSTARYFIEDIHPKDFPAKLRLLIHARLSIYVFFIVLSIMMAFKYFVFSNILNSKDALFILVITIFYGFMVGLNSCNSALHNASQQRLTSVFLNLLVPLFRLISVWMLSMYVIMSLELVFVIFLFNAIVAFFIHDYVGTHKINSYKLSYINSSTSTFFWQRKQIAYAVPITFMGISYWAVNAIDKYLAATYFSLQDLAAYSYLLQLTIIPISLFFSGISQFSWPIVFSKSKVASIPQKYVLNKLVYISLVCFIFFGLISLIIYENFFMLEKYIFPQDLEIKLNNFFILFLSGIVVSISQIFSLMHEFNFDTKRLMYIRILSAIIGILTLAICINLLSLSGLYIGHFLGSIIYLFINLIGIYLYKK